MSLSELFETYGLFFLLGQYPHGPLGGLALTLILAGSALILAMPLALLLAMARLSKRPYLRLAVSAWIYLIRATPLLMVIFWVYFFLPELTGIKLPQFQTMLLTLAIFNAAYLAEIIVAGIGALPAGQFEASRALGLTYWQSMRSVILPQALQHMLPSLINQFVSCIKDTSLAYIIGLAEVSKVASQINTLVFTMPGTIYAILGLSYFVICFGLSSFANYLQGRRTTSAAQAAIRIRFKPKAQA